MLIRPLAAVFLAAVFLAATLCLGAAAAEPAAVPDDPALEARVLAIATELRCLVCQNETLADSQADLAVDLRRQIRRQLAAGRSPEEIVDYMVARYGNFVRYRPPVNATTALLWGGPFLLLGVAGVAGWRRHRRGAGAGAPELTPAETERVRRLLAAEGDTA